MINFPKMKLVQEAQKHPHYYFSLLCSPNSEFVYRQILGNGGLYVKKIFRSVLKKYLTDVTDMVTLHGMIKSFAHKGLKALFEDGLKKGIQTKHADKLLDILDHLDAANEIKDIGYPGSGLHPLQPKSESRWAVSVSGNWRVTFKFKNGDAYEVNYEDYH